MNKTLTAIAVIAIAALTALPVGATNTWSAAPGSAPGSLLEQEGTSGDGPADIDATAQGPTNNDATDTFTNWKWLSGGGTYSGVYHGSDAWKPVEGDATLEVEADIELFIVQVLDKGKVYFHFGDISAATANQKRAILSGSYTSNNGHYIGLKLPTKTPVIDLNTGIMTDGMVSDRDSWRAQTNAFDIQFQCDYLDSNGLQPPVSFGSGSHGTQTSVLWFLPLSGVPGVGIVPYQFQIDLLPDVYQADGDYHLDPAVVCAPVL